MIKPPKADMHEWDGQVIEENKTMHRKLENDKSRWRWGVGVCLKDCANRGKKCGECVAIAGKYTEYEAIDETEPKQENNNG